jgi:hypothetical protein
MKQVKTEIVFGLCGGIMNVNEHEPLGKRRGIVLLADLRGGL